MATFVVAAVSAAGLALPAASVAQVPMDRGVVGTGLDLRGLDGLKRVLLIGAHPDDEDTALLTALARGMGAETAYLSLTRGGGGQNLIGPELGDGLAAIRTGELLAARELDGGVQFFTRAIDFGYSKTADETVEMWNEDEVLRDVALVVRRFRPHVIVSVWQGNASDGHGHHQASGVLAKQGFEAAADPARFPELADAGYAAWSTPKLYLLNRRSAETHTSVETGTYDPLLGRSWHQIAMESRSRHRSQDMGTAQPFGPRESRLLFEATHADGTLLRITDVDRASGSNADPAETFFAGVDTTLAGPATTLPGGADIATELGFYRGHIAGARTALGAGDPIATAQSLAEAIPPLERAILAVTLTARSEAPGAATGVRAYLNDLVERRRAVEEALLSVTGVMARAVVDDDLIVPGDTVGVQVEVWNGGPFRIETVGTGLSVPSGWEVVSAPRQVGPGSGGTGIEPGQVHRRDYRVVVPLSPELSRLYYREQPANGAMYVWPEDEPELWGLPKAPRPIRAEVAVQFAGSVESGPEAAALPADSRAQPLVAPPVSITLEGTYLGVDKAVGEFTKPPLVVPAVSVAMEPTSLVWPATPAVAGAGAAEGPGQDRPAVAEPLTREVTVRLDAYADAGMEGTLRLEVPDGWAVVPAEVDFDFTEAGQQEVVTFQVTPDGATEGRHRFRAVATAGGRGPFTAESMPLLREYAEGFVLLDYPHIERMAFFEPAETGVSVVPVRVDEVRVGYIEGSGDDGLLALRQMGVEARHVDAAELRRGNLSADFDVLVLGIRVYETQPEIAALNDRILRFAEEGGTVVTQYNKYEYPSGGYAPYEVSMGRGAPRATDETSPVEFIHPGSPVIDGPNELSTADFEGWVQERGLYFLAAWDDAFVPQIRFRDPGEDWTEGSVMVAPYGEGLYVYTGISFFRQFPAGVPGAYRLFANLVSLDRESWDAWAASR